MKDKTVVKDKDTKSMDLFRGSNPVCASIPWAPRLAGTGRIVSC